MTMNPVLAGRISAAHDLVKNAGMSYDDAYKLSGVAFTVVDGRTGFSKGYYTTGRAASRAADKADLAYGAVRYRREFVLAR